METTRSAMKINDAQAGITRPGDFDHFTGEVWMDELTHADDQNRLSVLKERTRTAKSSIGVSRSPIASTLADRGGTSPQCPTHPDAVPCRPRRVPVNELLIRPTEEYW
jgi:hypothetical protein